MAAKSFIALFLVALVAGAQAATVYDTAKAAGLTTLVAAIDAAGLTSVLDDPDFKGTVFAPTNEAFAKLLKALGITPAKLLGDKTLLTNVLKYHVVTPAVIPSSKIPTSYTTVKTLLGQSIKAKRNGHTGAVKIKFGKNYAGTSKVVKANVKADKAIVHVIDTVLVPSA